MLAQRIPTRYLRGAAKTVILKPLLTGDETVMRRFLLLPFMALVFVVPALADDLHYITPAQIDLAQVLPPPPALGSDAQRRDIAAMLAVQRTRTKAAVARAIADDPFSVFRFADVLGPNFNAARLPKLAAFLDRVWHDIDALTSGTRTYWHRERPFLIERNIHPLADLKKGLCNDEPGHGTVAPSCPNGFKYSYPSGHTAFGAAMAIILAQMVPERRAALFARGWQYGENRIVAGVHYPTDIEAGRLAAAIIVVLMMQNEHFRADLAAAKAELRNVLTSPALAPQTHGRDVTGPPG
jgi:acid phosphatase (class A)